MDASRARSARRKGIGCWADQSVLGEYKYKGATRLMKRICVGAALLVGLVGSARLEEPAQAASSEDSPEEGASSPEEGAPSLLQRLGRWFRPEEKEEASGQKEGSESPPA